MHASEEKFRSLVEDTADWVWEIDVEGRFSYSNSSVEDILGFTAGQIIGRTLWEYIVPEEREKSKSFFEESAEKKRAFRNLVNHYNHRDGGTVFLEASGRPILDDEGKLVGFRGVCRDITQRMIADKILKESELWDGKVCVLQVTNTTERAVELRALVSAADASTAWSLRCEVREKLIDFIQKNYPQALPKLRAELHELRK